MSADRTRYLRVLDCLAQNFELAKELHFALFENLKAKISKARKLGEQDLEHLNGTLFVIDKHISWYLSAEASKVRASKQWDKASIRQMMRYYTRTFLPAMKKQIESDSDHLFYWLKLHLDPLSKEEGQLLYAIHQVKNFFGSKPCFDIEMDFALLRTIFDNES